MLVVLRPGRPIRLVHAEWIDVERQCVDPTSRCQTRETARVRAQIQTLRGATSLIQPLRSDAFCSAAFGE